MHAIHIDIFSPPSNSQKSAECDGIKIDKHYEDVDFTEISFPDYKHFKRLGRGSYGTVVPCYFRGRIAAAKILESDVDHFHIHNEVFLFYN